MSENEWLGYEHRDIDTSQQEWGSDYISDLLKSYGFEFVPFNPGSSFRGLEESIVNYNSNTPMVVETPSEGLSVSIAHGYAKATGQPSLCILHNVVGTMNGAMSIYNAYLDRVPVVMLSGTGPVRKTSRRPWIEWIHTANIQGNIVREYVKWDDQPVHVDGIADSFLRGLEIAQTRPKGPIYITLDHDIQESKLEKPIDVPSFSEFPLPSRMSPEKEAIAKAGKCLVEAELPVILVDQVGDSRQAVKDLIKLAEVLGAPVLDIRRRRFNFPNTHPMYLFESDIYKQADVILALDTWEPNTLMLLAGDQSKTLEEAIEGEFVLIEVGTHELGVSSLFPNTGSYRQRDIPILADTEIAVPALLREVETRLENNHPAAERATERYREIQQQHQELRAAWWEEAKGQWGDTPISPARLVGELWEVLEDEKWVLVSDMFPRWSDRLWEVEEFDQYTGGHSGGGGVGYGIGGAIGGALAYSETDRIPINLQPDGDLMQYLAGLWIIAQQNIPLLTVMHNNMSMYNSTKHRMDLAEHRGRDASYEKALVGTGLWDPIPDYATVAKGLGMTSYGPVEDPDNLRPAFDSAWKDLKGGKPVLVDVVCQPR